MKIPETLEENIAYFEKTAKSLLIMDEFCTGEEAHENHIKTVTWHMRLVEWLKELQDYRKKENEHE
jgi:hypothetical protein